MYRPLSQLAPLNVECRLRLTQLLYEAHSIRLSGNDDELSQVTCRGSAVFVAYDPLDTCLRFIPGSSRYFSKAEYARLIETRDAAKVTASLRDFGSHVSGLYTGHFASYFANKEVATIFREKDYLSSAGLSLSDSQPDTLCELSPYAIVPQRHFIAKAFEEVKLELDIGDFSASPWLAWNEALDVTCFGPWVGLTADDIIDIIEHLKIRSTPGADWRGIPAKHTLGGKRIIIPFFVHGFQGIVSGFFTDLSAKNEQAVLTTLWQFGQTLSDIYFDLRSRKFMELARAAADADALVLAVLHIASPVERAVVQMGGKMSGYRLRREHGYWAGYEKLAAFEDMQFDGVKNLVEMPLPFGQRTRLLVEPVRGASAIDAAFAKLSLENCLMKFLSCLVCGTAQSSLKLSEVEAVRNRLRGDSSAGQPSMATWRHLYVAEKIIGNWDKSQVRIINNEIKQYLEMNLRPGLKSGYQISSYTLDLKKLFHNKITIEKGRNGITISW